MSCCVGKLQLAQNMEGRVVVGKLWARAVAECAQVPEVMSRVGMLWTRAIAECAQVPEVMSGVWAEPECGESETCLRETTQ